MVSESTNKVNRTVDRVVERAVRHNPFATKWTRPGAIPFVFTSGSAEAILDEFHASGCRGQIIGPHGSGKSTLLHTLVPLLRRRYKNVIWRTLHRHQRQSLPIRLLAQLAGTDSILVIDGFEQIWSPFRWLFHRMCGRGLLVTAHVDVGLPTLIRTRTDLQINNRLIRHLLNKSRDADDLARALDPESTAAIFRANRGNMREVLFRLYDVYEQRRHFRDESVSS